MRIVWEILDTLEPLSVPSIITMNGLEKSQQSTEYFQQYWDRKIPGHFTARLSSEWSYRRKVVNLYETKTFQISVSLEPVPGNS